MKTISNLIVFVSSHGRFCSPSTGERSKECEGLNQVFVTFGEFNVVGATPTFHIGRQASCLCILGPKTVGMFVHFCRCGKKNIYII